MVARLPSALSSLPFPRSYVTIGPFTDNERHHEPEMNSKRAVSIIMGLVFVSGALHFSIRSADLYAEADKQEHTARSIVPDESRLELIAATIGMDESEFVQAYGQSRIAKFEELKVSEEEGFAALEFRNAERNREYGRWYLYAIPGLALLSALLWFALVRFVIKS